MSVRLATIGLLMIGGCAEDPKVAGCAGGFYDCSAAPGCETPSSADDCGACGVTAHDDRFTCTGAPHVRVASCGGSTCNSTCAGGWCDANGDRSVAGKGCEQVDTDDTHCGPSCTACVNKDPVCSTVGCHGVDGNGDGVCTQINNSACATPFCLLPVNACTDVTWKDTDGDGLSDAWETPVKGENGDVPFADLNCNGHWDGADTDISLPGAHKDRKDIFVYYNHMDAHAHQPPQAALDQVVAAFSAHQIDVHFINGGPIPETVVTTLDNTPDANCTGTSVSTMKELRAAHFGNRQPAYHYMVFAHRATTVDATAAQKCDVDPFCAVKPEYDSTGSADLPGDDAIISFGALMDGNGQVPPEPFVYAGTIMHELGHNLGLKHGGPDYCVPRKPNYISVMEPIVMQLNGIPVADAPGSFNILTCAGQADCGPPTLMNGVCATLDACHCTTGQELLLGFNYCYRVDYSTYTLPALNELGTGCDGNDKNCSGGGLDERVGLNGPPTDASMGQRWLPGPSQDFVPVNGHSVDWNAASGDQEIHVKADINNDSSTTLLTTWDDWAHIDLRFQCTGGYGAGGSAFAASDEASFSRSAAENALGLPLELVIDVRPGSGNNWIMLRSSGSVPVALYGTALLDVTTVKLDTIRLAGAQPIHVAMADLNGDGRPDLLFDFPMARLGIDATAGEVTLTGARMPGQSLHGTDTITIVPTPDPTGD